MLARFATILFRVTMQSLPIALIVMLVMPPMQITPTGRHCPTAAVQEIQEITPNGVVSRAPGAKDLAFKQCRCAEERYNAPKCEGNVPIVTIDLPLCEVNFASHLILMADGDHHSAVACALLGRPQFPETPPPRA